MNNAKTWVHRCVEMIIGVLTGKCMNKLVGRPCRTQHHQTPILYNPNCRPQPPFIPNSQFIPLMSQRKTNKSHLVNPL